MPTYVCVFKTGLLNNLQKHRIAAQLPACTAETTGADVARAGVIDENEQRQRYLSGQPADHQIWIRGHPCRKNQRAAAAAHAWYCTAVSEISGVEESAIWVYLATSRQTIWWNTVTCCTAGAEQQWFQTLPQS